MPEKNDFQFDCDVHTDVVYENIPHLHWRSLPITDRTIAPNRSQLSPKGYQLLLMVIPPNADSHVKRRALVQFDRAYALWKTGEWLKQRFRGSTKQELRCFLIDLIGEISDN